MNDISQYLIQLVGQADIAEIDAMSPIQMTAANTGEVDPSGTLFTVCTDQSGLIGLMRHLHGLGLVFLSIKRLDPAGYPGSKEA